MSMNIEIEGIQYLTARQIEKEFNLSRKKCWQILSTSKISIRTQKISNTHLYALTDVTTLMELVAAQNN